MSEYIIDFTDANYIIEPIEHNGEIVRCKDCKHYEPDLYEHISCECMMRYTEPSAFCAWGERRGA